MRWDIRWVGFILALILGAVFELSKFKPNPTLTKSARLTIGQDIQPYSVSAKNLLSDKTEQPQQIQPIRGMHTMPAGPSVAQGNLPEVNLNDAQNKDGKKAEGKEGQAADGKDGKKDEKVTEADEFEDVIDPKTGQMIRRKKLKPEEAEKAKKEEEEKLAKQKAEEDEAEQKRLDDLEHERRRLAAADNNHQQDQMLLGGAAHQQAPATPTPTSGFNAQGTPAMSMSEWEKKLLSKPDASATTSFVQTYLSGNISSSNFYRIVNLMLKDSNPEIRSLGVQALGSTPSVTSFNELADLLKTENSASPLRPKIDGYLTQYTLLTNLDVLGTVMSASTSAFNVVTAMDKVDQSAQKYLSNKTDPSYKRNVAYFKPFISLLETLSKSTDASIVAQAQKTLADVKSLTGTT